MAAAQSTIELYKKTKYISDPLTLARKEKHLYIYKYIYRGSRYIQQRQKGCSIISTGASPKMDHDLHKYALAMETGKKRRAQRDGVQDSPNLLHSKQACSRKASVLLVQALVQLQVFGEVLGIDLHRGRGRAQQVRAEAR